MGTSLGNARFGTIFLNLEDIGLSFEVEDARVEITREVNSQGRHTGSALDIRVHVVVDLTSLGQGSNVTPRLFDMSIQANDIVQKFRLQWQNPITIDPSSAAVKAREMSFSGWIAGFELYRPEITGSADFGTTDASANTRLGRADQLLHCTLAVVTDDDNIGNLTLTE